MTIMDGKIVSTGATQPIPTTERPSGRSRGGRPRGAGLATGGRRNSGTALPLHSSPSKSTCEYPGAALAIGSEHHRCRFPPAQSTDLDQLMERVWPGATRTGRSCSNTCSTSRRRSTWPVPAAPGCSGFAATTRGSCGREYSSAARSRVNGVTLSEDERRKAETTWIRRERRRDERRKQRAANGSAPTEPGDPGEPVEPRTPRTSRTRASLETRRRVRVDRAAIRILGLLPPVQVRTESLRLVGRETMDGRGSESSTTRRSCSTRAGPGRTEGA